MIKRIIYNPFFKFILFILISVCIFLAVYTTGQGLKKMEDSFSGDILSYLTERGDYMDSFNLRSSFSSAYNTLYDLIINYKSEEYIKETSDIESVEYMQWNYRNLIKRLDDMQGLLYYIESNDGYIISNASPDKNALKKLPVYYILDNGEELTKPQDIYNLYYRYWGNYSQWLQDSGYTLYIGFTDSFVEQQSEIWRTERDLVQGTATTIIISLVIILISLILLTIGAGRRADTEEIQYNFFDKIYLDISACLVFFIVLGYLFVSISVFDNGWSYYTQNSLNFLITVFAVASAIVVMPVIGWYLSVVKRLKGRCFLRHTLVFEFLKFIWKLIVKIWRIFCNSVIALVYSMPVSAILLLFLFVFSIGCLVGIDYPAIYFITVIIGFACAVLFSLRLKKIVVGVKKVGSGDLQYKINIKGIDPLAKIAQSIDGMSEGMEKAISNELRSERLKTELVTNVSHDIRTPLTSIITYADLLNSEGLDSERAGEYLGVIIQKSQRLKLLTDDLFEASKAATGNIEVNLEVLDFKELLHQSFGEMSDRLSESGLAVKLNLPPEDVRIRADGRLMWRICENLLSNLIKYSMPQSRVYIELIKRESNCLFTIKNISAVELNVDPRELTERFKRGDESRTGGGSGLGLAIVQSFAEAQGGTFSVQIDGDLFKTTLSMPCA